MKNIKKRNNRSSYTTELLSKCLIKIKDLEQRVHFLEIDNYHLYEMIEEKR